MTTMTATRKNTKTTKKTVKVKAKVNGHDLVERARSPVVVAILGRLDRRSWTGIDELADVAGPHITATKAIKVFDYRIGKGKPFPRAEKIRRGKRMQVLLDCITLGQYNKIEARGRGETKEYRLI